ncbi:hypothetical protein ACUY28_01570 [Corynebacterium sanguinis]|uniref:hypothetical protein n=1 Tax=Corynebacterium sanguinis TaxID=2594913 RepID=UPI0010AB10D4|nr:hypothetical protein [Corynebacterium sanguinis]MCT1462810.1 hypothetical protein [Corynebacterium sanguinis]MCT1804426.1 hypothetical protein [Corynebacterium sanguinis]MCT2157753.1 hypothetical protein [Corynebacterium sanguinis]MCT2329060.1 hypothetical protein [Corynebacterium sanguinis]
MTTTLAATTSAVIDIDGMPARLRGDVEKLLCELPQDRADYSLFDVWDTAWFTRWHRNPDGTIGCRELVYAPAADLARFRENLAELAQRAGFAAQLTTRVA